MDTANSADNTKNSFIVMELGRSFVTSIDECTTYDVLSIIIHLVSY